MWNGKSIKMCEFHPLTFFVYFMVLIGSIIFLGNPYLYVTVLSVSLLISIYFEGLAIFKLFFKLLIISILFALINPLFSHEGMTIITYFPNGNALTLESIYFGISMGVLFISIMLLFNVFNKTMWPDRWVELFGNISPTFALMISMIFRFINRFIVIYKELKLVHKNKSPFFYFSMLVTYALESSIDTADSMAARGYKTSKRTHYKRQKIKSADIAIIIASILFLAFSIYMNKTYKFTFYYYPNTGLYTDRLSFIAVILSYIIYSIIPLIIEITEDIKWRLLTSKI